MAVQLKPRKFTAEEYLALERAAEFKSEFVDGGVYAMAGSSHEHVEISTQVAASFVAQLKGKPCKTYASDMRVRVPSSRMYSYSDVVVVCGEPPCDSHKGDNLLNPTVIVEVLSDSAESFDRGSKFAHYRTIESLTDYVLISQHKPCVEHFARQDRGDQWLYSVATNPQDAIFLVSIGCSLRLEDVYNLFRFEPE